MGDTRRETEATIRDHAAIAFKDHGIEPLGPNEWMCGRPGTGLYRFRVILRPGLCVVTGDIGDFVLRCYDADMLEWMKQAVDSPDYLMEKIRTKPAPQFYSGEILAYIDERIAENKRHGRAGGRAWKSARAAYLEAQEDGDEQRLWPEIVSEHLDGDVELYSLGMGPNPSLFWLVEALRWFAANVGKAKTVEAVAHGA